MPWFEYPNTNHPGRHKSGREERLSAWANVSKDVRSVGNQLVGSAALYASSSR